MKHFFVISGGTIKDDFALEYMESAEEKTLIAADSGMDFLYRNNRKPDVIVGDFDSVESEALAYFRTKEGITWYPLVPEKDDTDTEFAVRTALRMGAEKITILGGTGSRLDHVFGNVELLGIGMEQNVPMELVDANNRIRMIKSGITLEKSSQFGTYVSLIPYTECVQHLFLTGFKYPLADVSLKGFCSLGVSNEIVEDTAEIRFDGGILLVTESRD